MTISNKFTIKLLVAALTMATFNVCQLDAMKRGGDNPYGQSPAKKHCIIRSYLTIGQILQEIEIYHCLGYSEQQLVGELRNWLEKEDSSLLSVRNNLNRTVLHLACAQNDLNANSIVRIILLVAVVGSNRSDNGYANELINAVDVNGHTAFDMAQNNQDIMRTLTSFLS